MEDPNCFKVPTFSDVAFHVVGVGVTSLFAIVVLFRIYRLLSLYLLPRICRQKDLVSMYGKWAVITGGSDGIGKSCAMELAKRGLNICVISNFENNIVQDIKNQYDVQVKWIDVDFSTTEVFKMIKEELSQLDDIGILMNNVGTVQAEPLPLAESDPEFLMKILNINLTAMLLMTELVLKGMVKRDKGLIVNTASLSAKVPLPYFTMYCSTKVFIENYSACLALELSDTNVKVKCLEPAFVRTQLLKGFSRLTKYITKSPIFRFTFPNTSDFAASVVATFGYDTSVIYTGYWTQELLDYLIPHSIGKPFLAGVMKKVLQNLRMLRKP